MGPDERRRAGAAVQVLVAAADREVGAGAVQIDRHGAGGVREIPDHDRAGLMRRARQLGHPVHAAGAIVDVRQHQDRDAIVEMRRDLVGVDEHQLEAVLARERLGDVEIGREVRALRDDAIRGACRRPAASRLASTTTAMAALSTL